MATLVLIETPARQLRLAISLTLVLLAAHWTNAAPPVDAARERAIATAAADLIVVATVLEQADVPADQRKLPEPPPAGRVEQRTVLRVRTVIKGDAKVDSTITLSHWRYVTNREARESQLATPPKSELDRLLTTGGAPDEPAIKWINASPDIQLPAPLPKDSRREPTQLTFFLRRSPNGEYRLARGEKVIRESVEAFAAENPRK